MVLGVAAAITVPFVSIARMLNELATVTNSKPVDWWLLLVPFYSMHVMATVIPEEVRKAKASLHVARPPRSKLTYRTLWQYALAADLNDIAAALSVRNA